MEMGLPFRSSHPDVYIQGYNDPTPEHFGAHDLAPVTSVTKSPFIIWETKLNRSPGSLTLADDLSNLEDVVNEAYQIFSGK
jgi:hypothetical protein